MLHKIKWIIVIFLGVVALAFVISNRARVVVDFFPFPYEANLPLFILLFMAVALGALIGWMIGCRQNVHVRRKLKTSELQTKAMEKELASCKAEEVLRQNLLQIEKKG